MKITIRTAAQVVLVCLILLPASSLYLLRTPAPVQKMDVQDQFSAGRAFRYVEAIAQRPHASGTNDHRRVRRYILSELQALGIEVEVQSQTVSGSSFLPNSLSHVYNVVARIKGRESGSAVLLVAHYDSQPNSPGAGDDASGVAILLETARIIQQDSMPANDIIFLFTDGEEYGLFGASAFLEHRWFRDVALVLNSEGRGNRGLSLTFEVSAENGWLIREYAKVAPYPYANSLSYEVYKAMPNDTDFTIFKQENLPGLNMAFIGGLVHYHGMTDTPSRLSLGTLQQQGSNMLALARHFGNISLETPRDTDMVFFNTVGFHLVWYPMKWNAAFLALVGMLYLCSLLLALIAGEIKGEALLYAFFVQIGLLVGSIAAAWLVASMINAMHPSYKQFISGGLYNDVYYYIAFIAITVLIYSGVLAALFRRMHPLPLAFGGYTIWLILAIAVYFSAPSAAYFFVFPLLFALVGPLIFLVAGWDLDERAGSFALLNLVSLAPGILLIVPTISLAFPSFGMYLPAFGVLVCALLLSLLTPLMYTLSSWRPYGLSYAAAAVGGIALVLAGWFSRYTEDRPLQSHVSYYLDADEGQAFWVSSFEETDEWNQQFFPYPEVGPLSEIYPFAQRIRLKSPARAINIPAPDVRVLEDTTYRGQRRISLVLRSQREACHMQLWVRNRKGVEQVSIDGELLKLSPTPGPGGRYYFWTYFGLPREREINVDMLVSDLGTTELVVIDQALGLPPDLDYTPMPPEIIPGAGNRSNLTVIKRRLEF